MLQTSACPPWLPDSGSTPLRNAWRSYTTRRDTIHRSTTRNAPGFFPEILYKGRARIEQTIGKLKRFKRIALRCEKTAENYASLVAFACALILVKSVHIA
jgi:transposase